VEGGGRGLLLLRIVLASSALFDCYVARSREKRSVSVFPRKKSMVAA